MLNKSTSIYGEKTHILQGKKVPLMQRADHIQHKQQKHTTLEKGKEGHMDSPLKT